MPRKCADTEFVPRRASARPKLRRRSSARPTGNGLDEWSGPRYGSTHYSFRPIYGKALAHYQCPMNDLITVVTRFQLPAGVTAEQIREAFDEAAPKFRNVPGLIRKQFLCSKDCRAAGGVYLWNDENAARAFMNERVAPMIREKFHVDPTIEFYDSPVIVEN